jgi:signal transduction histidine kinase
LSHELRTPVHSIIGFSQALLDGISGKLAEKQEKYVSIVSKNATSLLTLLNNILDLSKIEAGKMEFNFKNFDVIQLINSVTEITEHFAEDKKLAFSVDLSDVVRRNIYSDENMLRQVLLNILNNAVKFTEIGSVNIKVLHPDLEFLKSHGVTVPFDSTDKSYLMFSVTDTGIGISDEDSKNIFDEYRQFDRSASKKYGGTGLGLAITKKILNNLGGSIWVESEYSQGSTFSVVIPVDRPKSAKEA